MGFEIPVDVDYFDHPKTMALIGIIGPEADIYPLRLWRWCALYAKEGVVTAGRPQIEGACKWQGKPGALYRALMKAGFVEADGITIHSWLDHVGRAIRLYETKKRKQREKYAAEVNHGTGILPEENDRIPPIQSHPKKSQTGSSEKSAKRGERRKKPPLEIVIPDKINTPAFAKAWGEWQAYRRERRLTCAEATLRGQLGKLEKLGSEAAIKEIEESIANGWQSVCYEPKNGTPNGKAPSGLHVGPAGWLATKQQQEANGDLY